MAKKVKRPVKKVFGHGEKKILIGALIFFVGLLRYLEIGWAEILMIVGAVIVLKGVLIKK